MQRYYFIYSRDSKIMCSHCMEDVNQGVRVDKRKFCMSCAADFLGIDLHDLQQERSAFIRSCVAKKEQGAEMRRTKKTFRRYF